MFTLVRRNCVPSVGVEIQMSFISPLIMLKVRKIHYILIPSYVISISKMRYDITIYILIVIYILSSFKNSFLRTVRECSLNVVVLDLPSTEKGSTAPCERQRVCVRSRNQLWNCTHFRHLTDEQLLVLDNFTRSNNYYQERAGLKMLVERTYTLTLVK